MKHLLFAAVISLGTLAIQAQATVFSFSDKAPGGNHRGGKVKNLETSFNTATNVWSWSYDVKDRNNRASNGFWLVISGGENPKYNRGEYAIFYGDANRGILSAYEYSGQNNSNSWNDPGVFLGSFDLNYSYNSNRNRGSYDFSIDVSGINSANIGPNWVGALFGEHLGYWFHPFIGGEFTYGRGNIIDSLSYDRQGWYDKNQLQTTQTVPEPSPFFLLAFGLACLVIARKRSV